MMNDHTGWRLCGRFSGHVLVQFDPDCEPLICPGTCWELGIRADQSLLRISDTDHRVHPLSTPTPGWYAVTERVAKQYALSNFYKVESTFIYLYFFAAI